MSVEFGRVYDYPQGIKVIYSHVNDEPAMALCRNHWGKRTAFIVGLSSAGNYTEDDYLVAQAMTAATVLNFTPDKKTVFMIADILQQHIEELVMLPPPPAEDTRKIIEDAIEKQGLKVKLNGENVLGSI